MCPAIISAGGESPADTLTGVSAKSNLIVDLLLQFFYDTIKVVEKFLVALAEKVIRGFYIKFIGSHFSFPPYGWRLLFTIQAD